MIQRSTDKEIYTNVNSFLLDKESLTKKSNRSKRFGVWSCFCDFYQYSILNNTYDTFHFLAFHNRSSYFHRIVFREGQIVLRTKAILQNRSLSNIEQEYLIEIMEPSFLMIAKLSK